MKMTATEVYNKLLNDDKILTQQGRITFKFSDVNIIVKQRDVVGNIMQEWLQGWLDNNGIEYAPSENSQMPPDFFLNPDDKTKDLLEVKAFNRNAGPGFDIADFRMYQGKIIDKPYMLNVDYLIFGYDMSDDGIVTIKDVWIKKVWEITRRMEEWPINLQIKEGHVHKIRPGVWYSSDTNRNDYSIFRSMEDFISAMEETVYQNDETRREAAQWKRRFLSNYQDYYGEVLDIPRWYEIADSYDLKTQRKIEKAQEKKQKAEDTYSRLLEREQQVSSKLEEDRIRGNASSILKEEDRLEKIKMKIESQALKVSEAVEKYEALVNRR